MTLCAFCDPAFRKIPVLENEHWFVQWDGHPITKGHLLLIPKMHIETFFDIGDMQISAMHQLLKEAKLLLDTHFHPQGYNIGMNSGKAAGQTIFHLHIHLIPRYDGDVRDPTGGVRNIIPHRGNYLKSE